MNCFVEKPCFRSHREGEFPQYIGTRKIHIRKEKRPPDRAGIKKKKKNFRKPETNKQVEDKDAPEKSVT